MLMLWQVVKLKTGKVTSYMHALVMKENVIQHLLEDLRYHVLEQK